MIFYLQAMHALENQNKRKKNIKKNCVPVEKIRKLKQKNKKTKDKQK